jgi:hypothetical protein
MQLRQPDGKVGHAELRIGDAPIMLADEFPEINFRSPQSIGGTPVNILIYVNDVDALVDQARAAGSEVAETSGGSTLWQPGRCVGGPIRPFVVIRHAHRRCFAGGNLKACSRQEQYLRLDEASRR